MWRHWNVLRSVANSRFSSRLVEARIMADSVTSICQINRRTGGMGIMGACVGACVGQSLNGGGIIQGKNLEVLKNRLSLKARFKIRQFVVYSSGRFVGLDVIYADFKIFVYNWLLYTFISLE